jgi:hypothetical protein
MRAEAALVPAVRPTPSPYAEPYADHKVRYATTVLHARGGL